MRTLLCIALALSLSACGGDDQPTKTGGDGGQDTNPDTTKPEPSDNSATLPTRTTPFNVGDTAGAFAALPESKTVVVFYRGHW